MIVPVRVLEGPLGAFMLRDFVLQWCQGVPEFGVTWFRFQCISLPCPVSHCSCADLSRFIPPDRTQPPVAAAPGAIHPVADRILLGVILVVLLGRIECTGCQNLRRAASASGRQSIDRCHRDVATQGLIAGALYPAEQNN